MNCVKGDLAVIISSLRGDQVGKLVVVKDFILLKSGSPGWITQCNVFCFDKNLRPIRDQPGEDETLTWASVPQKETV